MKTKKPATLLGIHPVTEALKASQRRCHKIVIEEGKTGPRIRSLLATAKTHRIRVETLPKSVFQQKFKNTRHQGVIGYFSEIEPLELEELIENCFRETSAPTLVLLDGILDPQNLGAIIRSAEILGIQGLIIPQRRTAPLNETVARCSAGAIENLPIACTSNLADALKLLKKSGFWIVGVEPRGATSCSDFKFDMATALLIGGEEKGIRPLLRKTCDFTVSIPMVGAVDSLNASAASAIVFYEILRQKNQRGEK